MGTDSEQALCSVMSLRVRKEPVWGWGVLFVFTIKWDRCPDAGHPGEQPRVFRQDLREGHLAVTSVVPGHSTSEAGRG